MDCRSPEKSDIERPGPAQDFAEDDGAPEIGDAVDVDAERLSDATLVVGADFGGGRKSRRQALAEQLRGRYRRRQGGERRPAAAVVWRRLRLQRQTVGRGRFPGVDAKQFIQKLWQATLSGRRWPGRP